ncbi:MAG: Ribosome-recycling factor [Chlamydiia bacterium]|nr:Ribosome-recycling factor [Chlamydiia bacterium]
MSLEKEAEQMMKKSVEFLEDDYKTLRTNRVNSSMLDSLIVTAYGSEVALKTVASISVQDRNLIITPFDPSISGEIVKAINASQLNLNAIDDGGTIRVPVPPLNEALRRDIAKQAKAKLEQAKISIRDVRRKYRDQAKKEGDFTTDDLKSLDKKLQVATDEMCSRLDQLYLTKEKEIMTV